MNATIIPATPVMITKILIPRGDLVEVGDGSNVKSIVVDGKLVLVIDLTHHLGPTLSGKSVTIAATKGYAHLGDGIRVSVWVGKKLDKPVRKVKDDSPDWVKMLD